MQDDEARERTRRGRAEAAFYVQPDDGGYKPAQVDPLLKGAARATGATAKAVKRGKALTRYEHQKADS